ncbi:MAG: penicillin-binding protein 1C [Bacteroidales bacterium]|nr:penicillin-binding protein 1C [Bacteroidales bacterium]
MILIRRVLFFAAGFITSYILFILFLGLFYPVKLQTKYSPIVLARDSSLIGAYLTDDDKWRMYTELQEITPELKKAILFKEDKYFYIHFGINPVSVIRASFNNIRTGRRTSGASTITMQVARLLEPKERTYRNKIIEIFRAFQLELKFTKDEIFQMYLNLVPYGSNIEGVKSASVIYFGKMPDHLSLAEIAALSIIPNRPVSLQPGKNNELIMAERNKWLLRYQHSSLFDSSYVTDALEEKLNAYRRQIPISAPHISLRLKNQYPDRKIVRSTINPLIQAKASRIVKNYINTMYFQNIKNATVLIVDNHTREVLAYIGSADFDNNEDGGQVDGIVSVRSPGSTLKPYLYGIAFDKGIITPKTIITDVPVSFSGYEPENYDDKFYGNITVENALSMSLNVPAVKIMAKLGSSKFVNKLIDAGFQQIKKDKEHLGLSVSLGGCGVTNEELTTLFSAFANSGIYKKLKYIITDSSDTEKRILTESSAYMITEILTGLQRPDLPLQWANSSHMPKIAWKTGTSYGRRDAWSIGYNKDYTIGVWVGNFSGEGVPELNGSEKAAPLVFRLFNAIDYNSESNWFEMPDELNIRYVCQESGKVPGEYCTELVMDYYLPGISDNTKCNHLKKVYVNPDSTISYCMSCRPALGYVEALYPNPAPEIITFYNENNIHYRKIPPHNPDCERLMSGKPPVITSPVHENTYYVNVADSMEVMLSCHTSPDVEKVYWYIDKKFYRSAKAGEEIFFLPGEGKVEISCSDDKGRNTDIFIFVEHVGF